MKAMNAPICEFVKRYAESNALRLHMPGHKGVSLLGMEKWDITEISGADSLYEADGIIRESEENASALFGCPTFYSTEGSSQCIRAMLQLTLLRARAEGRRPLVLAGRNAHKTFLSAAALLGFDVEWLYPAQEGSYLSCPIDPAALEEALRRLHPAAVYLTSPDYLGCMADVSAAARLCHRFGALLLVDNAHGAYLRFLPASRHPMDLGADLCCDSAHKTLPALTGAAYLHISSALADCQRQAKNALALFGSTSPSYLILQSLDAVNPLLAGDFPARLAEFSEIASALRARLAARGLPLIGDEPMKLTLAPKAYGYSGTELAALLEAQNIHPEFADPDHLVLMLSPELGVAELNRLENALLCLPRRAPIEIAPPRFRSAERVCSIREAALSPCEIIPAEQSAGRVLAAATVGCPPAVPIVVCGERIDRHAVECFRYYGIKNVNVMK